MSGTSTGARGEKFIHELLPGSDWVNEERERNLPYDVTWEGIKIDVKTSLIKTQNKRSFTFVIKLSPRYNGVVLVFLALGENESFFWVDKCYKGVKSSRHLRVATPLADLPEAIRMAAAKEVPIITEEDTSKSLQQKMVNLDLKHHEMLKAIARKMTEEYRVLFKSSSMREVTMRAALSYAINRYADKMDIHIEE